MTWLSQEEKVEVHTFHDTIGMSKGLKGKGKVKSVITLIYVYNHSSLFYIKNASVPPIAKGNQCLTNHQKGDDAQ